MTLVTKEMLDHGKQLLKDLERQQDDIYNSRRAAIEKLQMYQWQYMIENKLIGNGIVWEINTSYIDIINYSGLMELEANKTHEEIEWLWECGGGYHGRYAIEGTDKEPIVQISWDDGKVRLFVEASRLESFITEYKLEVTVKNIDKKLKSMTSRIAALRFVKERLCDKGNKEAAV